MSVSWKLNVCLLMFQKILGCITFGQIVSEKEHCMDSCNINSLRYSEVYSLKDTNHHINIDFEPHGVLKAYQIKWTLSDYFLNLWVNQNKCFVYQSKLCKCLDQISQSLSNTSNSIHFPKPTLHFEDRKFTVNIFTLHSEGSKFSHLLSYHLSKSILQILLVISPLFWS